MFRRNVFCIALTLFLASVNSIQAQKKSISDFTKNVMSFYSSGDFLKAEKYLLEVLETKDSLNSYYLIATYNNFGVINNLLGRYEDALKYLNLAESAIGINKQSSPELANIYINKGRIYGIIKESDKAIAYFEQGVKIYLSLKETNQVTLFRISTAYLNLGVTYFEKKDYPSALQYLEKSLALKLRYNLSEVALPYLNLAKTYAKTGNTERAQRYFLESIASFNREHGQYYYRLADVYFDYGLFL